MMLAEDKAWRDKAGWCWEEHGFCPFFLSIPGENHT